MVQVFSSLVLLYFFHYLFLQNSPPIWTHTCDICSKLGRHGIVTQVPKGLKQLCADRSLGMKKSGVESRSFSVWFSNCLNVTC